MNRSKQMEDCPLGCVARLGANAGAEQEPAGEQFERIVDDIAESYVVLALQFGKHDKHFVDAYFGPEHLRRQANERPLSLADVRANGEALRLALADLPELAEDRIRRRVRHLDGALLSLLTRLEVIGGNPPNTFDQECALIFGTVARRLDDACFQGIIDELNRLVPGEGELKVRLAALRDRFVVPRDKIEATVGAAIDECRRRTVKHFELPEGEGIDLEVVNGKPWTAYNWYRGNARSVIQINADVPVYLERVVDFGCHEAYPGHHVYGIITEQELLKKRDWVEFSVWPLFSSMALLGEGMANYGISLAFSDDERLAFDKTVIMPLAGIDPEGLEDYYHYVKLRDALNFAHNEAARNYLEGRISRADVVDYLVNYGLESRTFAESRATFIETYRTYLINYNHGLDLVSHYIESRCGDDRAARWQLFGEMISNPVRPEDMEQKGISRINW